jgi:hypothetical protein
MKPRAVNSSFAPSVVHDDLANYSAIDVADVWLEGVVGKRGLAGARRQCCTSVCSQDRLRSRLISAARLGRSFSPTALNFNPSPPPGFTCRTSALARICPSWTRKWRLAVAPRRFVLGVSMNNPPALRFFTRDRSQSPVHSQ